MNSNIYRCKFLFIFFVCVTLLSCGEKIIYDKHLNVLKIQENVDNKIKKKETGIFSYPKFGFSFSLKKGKFNGRYKHSFLDYRECPLGLHAFLTVDNTNPNELLQLDNPLYEYVLCLSPLHHYECL